MLFTRLTRSHGGRVALVAVPVGIATAIAFGGVAQGAVPVSFSVSGQQFQISADKLDGQQFSQYAGVAKDTAGNYLYRNPEDSRLNGLHPVIVTGLPAKTALVLDSSRVGISTDKIGMVYEWDTLTRKSFNEANVLVEGRFSFDIFAPASIVKVGTAA